MSVPLAQWDEKCALKPYTFNTLGREAYESKNCYDLCMGDRNCNKVCPDVFEYDEDQLISRVLVDEVPKDLEDLVRKAAEECAPGAIIVAE